MTRVLSDIRILDNLIHDVAREGILLQSQWINKPDDPNSSWRGHGAYTPSTGIRVASNRLERIAGDGIVLPGFVNTHTHLAMTLMRGLADDLRLKEWLEKHIWPAEARVMSAANVALGSRLAAATPANPSANPAKTHGV